MDVVEATTDWKVFLVLGGNTEKIINAGYYGVGNASSDVLLPDDTPRLHQYIMTQATARISGRLPLDDALFVQAGLLGHYAAPEFYAGSRLAADAAGGELFDTVSHGLLQGAIGLVWDTRDEEIWIFRLFARCSTVRRLPGARASILDVSGAPLTLTPITYNR